MEPPMPDDNTVWQVVYRMFDTLAPDRLRLLMEFSDDDVRDFCDKVIEEFARRKAGKS